MKLILFEFLAKSAINEQSNASHWRTVGGLDNVRAQHGKWLEARKYLKTARNPRTGFL
jgi:hypothetical protein